MASLCPSPLVGGCGPRRRFPHLWKPTVSGRRLQCEGLFCSGEKDTLFITFENQFLKISLISNIMCVWERKNRPGVTSLLWFKKSFSQSVDCFGAGIWGEGGKGQSKGEKGHRKMNCPPGKRNGEAKGMKSPKLLPVWNLLDTETAAMSSFLY